MTNQLDLHEFCVYKDENFIPIKAWDNEIDIDSIAGDEIESNTVLLGPTADTFAGSYSKTIFYKDLRVRMFSPKGNGETFWIDTIEVIGKDYSTDRGIKIGDALEHLIRQYPEIVNYGDENYRYANPVDEYMYILFIVKDGIIKSFQIKYEIP